MGFSAAIRRGLTTTGLVVAAVVGVATSAPGHPLTAAPPMKSLVAIRPAPTPTAAAPTAAAPTAAAPTAATPAPTPAPPTGDFAFLAKDADRPVRYDPCTPIHYVVNLALAPAGASADIQRAVSEIAAATGLTFVFDGTTDETPMAHRGMTRNSRYKGWPPLLIGWAKPSDTDLLTGGAIGEGGSTWFGNPGREVYVTGVVVLDATQNAKLRPGFGGDSVGAVLLHELGHVVGLDHVADTSQIMFATVTDKPAVLGQGDLAGLSQVGRAEGCLRQPAPAWPG